MSEKVVQLTVHTPDREIVHVDDVQRVRELEEQLARALLDVAHYEKLTRLLCEKYS